MLGWLIGGAAALGLAAYAWSSRSSSSAKERMWFGSSKAAGDKQFQGTPGETRTMLIVDPAQPGEHDYDGQQLHFAPVAVARATFVGTTHYNGQQMGVARISEVLSRELSSSGAVPSIGDPVLFD